MRFVFGVLGWAAKVGAKMSRTRLNLIPGNWWLIGSCALVACLGVTWNREALMTAKTPQKATVTQVWRGASHARYLSVMGEVHPEQNVSVQGGYSSNTLTPVIDRASGKGFFASIPAASAGSTPRILMLTGTTHSLDSSVRDRLNVRFNTGAIRYNPYIFLDVGGKPESPFIGLLATLVCGTIAALFLATSLLQHTIFQRTRETKTPQNVAANSSFSSSSATMSATMMDATSSTRLAKESALCAPRISGEIGDLRITGKLRLHEKAAQRFTDMPASRLHLEDGSYAFASNIDASTRTYGVVTTKRVGLWLLMPNLRTVQWEEGNLYNGFRPRPALRLKFEDALDKNRRSTAIFSFADDASRAQLIAELQQETARALAA